MSAEKSICAVCAWRENCKKKFSISGQDVNCADYTRDLTIKDSDKSSGETQDQKPAK